MTRHLSDTAINTIADLHANPQQTVVDRTFELPTRLYALTVGAYLAFLGLMGFGLPSRGLIIPMAIFTIYIAMAFGVPTLWARMNPEHRSKAMSWRQFSQHGINTATGRISGRDATIQVLILPVWILLWGFAAITIVALV